jgi:hypothetical protein
MHLGYEVFTGRTYPISKGKSDIKLIGSAIENEDFTFGLYILLYSLMNGFAL